MQKGARGDKGGVSIFPALPLFPLGAWGLAHLLERLGIPYALLIVGGAHLVLLAALLCSIAKSKLLTKQARNS